MNGSGWGPWARAHSSPMVSPVALITVCCTHWKMTGYLTYLTTYIFIAAITCSCPDYKLVWIHFMMVGTTTQLEWGRTWVMTPNQLWEMGYIQHPVAEPELENTEVMKCKMSSNKWEILILIFIRSSAPLLGSHYHGEFSSNPNQTHLKQLIKLFRITWNCTCRCAEAGWK